MELLGFLILVGLLCLYEIPRVRREEGPRALWAFAVAMALATLFDALLILGVPIPSPTKLIDAIFAPLGRAVMGR